MYPNPYYLGLNRQKKSDSENNSIMLTGSTKNQKARVIQLMPDVIQVLRRLYAKGIYCNLDDLVSPTKTVTLTRRASSEKTDNPRRRF